MNDIIKQIKFRMGELVELNRGMKESHLEFRVIQEFEQAKPDDITRAIHEAVQDGLIRRLEYVTLSNRSQIYRFYLPQGSRLL